MSHTLELQQKHSQNIKQLQHLIMSRQMQQAIHFLQMPIMELTPLIDQEIEQNPLLEYSTEEESAEDQSELKQLENEHQEELLDRDNVPEKELSFKEDDFEIMRRLEEDFRDHFSETENIPIKRSKEEDKLHTFLENSILSEETLFEHLMNQAKEFFETPKHLEIAESLIGNLDERGFLNTPLEELAVLKNCSLGEIEKILREIQTFDPLGIGARNLQESLLIQLKNQDKETSLSYKIIDQHFDDLLHNRIPIIKKRLHCTTDEIEKSVDDDIAKLNLHPGNQWRPQITSFIIPDVTLRQEDEELIVAINDDFMPKLRLNYRYLHMLNDESLPEETKNFIKQKIISAKWLLRNMMQRNDTLENISKSLAKSQRDFFLQPNGALVPLTMKTVAEEIGVHESTIARAVSGKYLDSPRGLLPLRSFFTSSLSTNQGMDISSKTARDMVKEMIATENKKHPLSDEKISAMIKEKGIQCARRTVAKYRAALKIGTAQQRRKF